MDHTSPSSGFLSTLKYLLLLMRPKQWVKNGFVLAPLIFAGKFLDAIQLQHAVLAFVMFCLASSATYIMNDIRDLAHDRTHPVKSKKRPLAAGKLSVTAAKAGLVLVVLVLAGLCLVLPKVGAVIGAYLLLNVAYSFVLKHQPVLDIFCIAIGFVLRVYAGAVALTVPLSPWMFMATLCLALYLAALKRRQELLQVGDGSRKVLAKYSVELVDRYAEMSGMGALVFYGIFVAMARPELVITVPVVIFGLFRYWYVVEILEGGESPTDALLTDRQMQLVVVAWVVACIWAVWPKA